MLLTAGCVRDTSAVTGDNRGNLKFWTIQARALTVQWTISGHKDAITTLEIIVHHGKTYVLSGSMDKNVTIHTAAGTCIGSFGNKDGWQLVHGVEGQMLIPPRADVRYTHELVEDTKGVEPEAGAHKSDERRELKGLLKYVAPFRQIDLTQFSVDRKSIPTNYEDLYFQLFGKKLDKKMKP
jgi:hypothetical protein